MKKESKIIAIGCAVIIIAILFFSTNPDVSNFSSQFSLQSVSPMVTQELILHPNGKGAYTELTPHGSTDNWKCVLGAPVTRLPSLVDWCSLYVAGTSNVNVRDTYQMENHNPSKDFGTIQNIQLFIKYKSFLGSIKGVLYLNGELYETASFDSWSDPQRYYYTSWQFNKNPLNNQPWTWQNIDDLQPGIWWKQWGYGQGKSISDVYVKVISTVDATINSNPSGATVTIQGIGTKNAGETFSGLTPFETYTVTISKQYYFDKTITITMNDNVQQTVTLLQSHFQVTITPTPSDAIVKMNGVTTKTGMYTKGTVVTVTANKQYYADASTTVVVSGEQTVPVQLQRNHFTLTIVPTPSTATITLNGVEINSDIYKVGTIVHVQVSQPHFVTQSRDITIDKDETINIGLAQENPSASPVSPAPKTPGFEMIVLIAALGIAMILIKKMRK